MIIATACNDRYLPGVLALHNSFKANVSQWRNQFVVVAFGDGHWVERLRSYGITVVQNPPHFTGLHLPAPGVWDNDKYDVHAMRACYCRIALPHIFDYYNDRILWVDGDCHFHGDVDELNDLDMGERVIATPQSKKQLRIFKDMGIAQRTIHNLKTGTMLFDAERYRWRRHWDNMQGTIHKHGHLFNDSTVNCAVNLEFKGDAVWLPDHYSYNAKHRNPTDQTKIVHWSICEPWNNEMMAEKPELIQDQVNRWWRPYEAA